MKTPRQLVEACVLRRISVSASVDPRTLVKVLRGERVRGLAAERAYEALRAAGLIETLKEGGT